MVLSSRLAYLVPMGVAGVTAGAIGAAALAVGLGAGPSIGAGAGALAPPAASAPFGSAAVAASAPFGSAAVAASVVLASTGSAQSLPAVQARAAKAIGRRVGSLNAAIAKVTADSDLGSGQAVILQHLQADVPALQQLGQKIAADTTVTAARSDAETVYSDYRVYALVLPAARLAARSDALTTTDLPQLTARSAALAAKEDSADQATVAPLIADLNVQIGGASTAASGVATSVEGFAPSQWNANHALLSPARASFQTARSDVRSARQDVVKIRAALRAGGTKG
jgi:hypothetical protein